MNKQQQLIDYVKSLQGYTKYLMGAKHYNSNNNPQKPHLLDCSGFVKWLFMMLGYTVPDGTYYQWQGSEEVNPNNIKIGDIGIKEYGGIGKYNHIGVYIGNGQWAHCSYSKNGIVIEKTNIFKYIRRFKGISLDNNSSPKNKIKKDDLEMIEQKEFIVNGRKVIMDTIVKNNYNYVKLQDLKEQKALIVDYDKQSKLPIIQSIK